MKKRIHKLILVLIMLYTPALTLAQGLTYYYGIYQHYYSSFINPQPVVDGIYDRQNNNFISGVTRVVFASAYGFPPEQNEEWRYELRKSSTNEVLSYISFIWTKVQDYGCISYEVDNSGYYYLGCSYDPWQVWLIGSFYTRCFDTDQYKIVTSHSGVEFTPNPFEPTPFQPGPATINGGSLASILPTLPHHTPESTNLSITVKDNLSCGKPVEDAPISVKNTIIPQSGSHKHFNSGNDIGTGKYISANPIILSSSNSGTEITSTTDADGNLFAVYNAGDYGVSEKVTITVTNPVTSQEMDTTGTLDIKIPGLISLEGDNTSYTLSGTYSSPCDIQHNDSATIRRSAYLLPRVKNAVEGVANDYLNRSGAKLSFNDGSLMFGGKFDKGLSDRSKVCHVSHRIGNDIDVNSIDSLGRDIWFDYYFGPNNCVIWLYEDLDARAEIHGGRNIIENNSIHYRFDRI